MLFLTPSRLRGYTGRFRALFGCKFRPARLAALLPAESSECYGCGILTFIWIAFWHILADGDL
jgi:hypothetical protein